MPVDPTVPAAMDVLVSFKVGPEVTGLGVNGGGLKVEAMVPATTGSNSTLSIEGGAIRSVVVHLNITDPDPATGVRFVNGRTVLKDESIDVRILVDMGIVDIFIMGGRLAPTPPPTPAPTPHHEPGCALATEGQDAVLSCAAGQVIHAIDFASFGKPTGSCGSGFKIDPACNSNHSVAVVSGACLGKPTCTIQATCAEFHEHLTGPDAFCWTVRKSLAIRATCVARSPRSPTPLPGRSVTPPPGRSVRLTSFAAAPIASTVSVYGMGCGWLAE